MTKTNPLKRLVRTEKWSQVFLLFFSCFATVYIVNDGDAGMRLLLRGRSLVHFHLFCARLCVLAFPCFSLPFCFMFRCWIIMSATVLVVYFGGLLHCGLRSVDDWVTNTFQLLVWK